MKIRILNKNPEQLADSQQALLDWLIKLAKTKQVLTEGDLMRELNLSAVESLRSRFSRLQDAKIIEGWVDPSISVEAA